MSKLAAARAFRLSHTGGAVGKAGTGFEYLESLFPVISVRLDRPAGILSQPFNVMEMQDSSDLLRLLGPDQAEGLRRKQLRGDRFHAEQMDGCFIMPTVSDCKVAADGYQKISSAR